MTTLLEVSGGKIVMRDTDGHTVFDSDEKLFQATNRATGSVSIGPWTATATTNAETALNTQTDHFLQNVNVACDTVVGAFRLTSVGNPAYGVGGLGWFNASGTYVHYQDAGSSSRWALIAFTFYCAGGGLYLRERIILRASQPFNPGVTNTHQVLGLTFDYNLYCGSFV